VAENQVTLRIKQVRSTISHPAKQREVLRTLGLRRIGMSVERPDNAAVRGSIRAVNHLVSVEVLGGGEKKVTKKKAAAPDGVEVVKAAPPVAEATAQKATKKTTKKAATKKTAKKKTTKKTAATTAKKATKKTAKKASKASGGSS